MVVIFLDRVRLMINSLNQFKAKTKRNMKNKLYSSSIIILFLGVFSYLNFIPHRGESNHIENRLYKNEPDVHVKFKDKNRWVKGGKKTVFFNFFRTKKAEIRNEFYFRNDFSVDADSIRFRFNYNKLRKQSNLNRDDIFEIDKHAPYFQYDSLAQEIYGKVVSSFCRKYYQITVSAYPAHKEKTNSYSQHDEAIMSHIHGHLCSPTEGCDIIR